MKLSIDPCSCDLPSIYHSVTHSGEGFREYHCRGTGKMWLEGHASRRMVEIMNVVEKNFPKGSNISVEALRKQSHAGFDTAKKVLKYLSIRKHPLNGEIVVRPVSYLQYYHDPVGEVIEFQCKNCGKPVLIDPGSTTVCPNCELATATYFMCPCRVVLDVSDLPPVFICEKCGKKHVAEYQLGRGSLLPAAIGLGVGSFMLLVSMI